MLSAFRSALTTPDLRRKILFTLGILAVYRLGAGIPSPGVSYPNVQKCIAQVEGGANAGVYSLINLFSGGALLQLSVFALGIMPYITSSIIIQLLTVVIPRFEQLKKEGQSGQNKLTQYTRYLTIALAVLQGTGIIALADRGQLFGDCDQPVIPDSNVWTLSITVLVMTAGTGVIMWLGEQITERGIGNGMSLLIFTGIAARIPAEGRQIMSNGGLVFAGVCLFGLAIIVFVTSGLSLTSALMPLAVLLGKFSGTTQRSSHSRLAPNARSTQGEENTNAYQHRCADQRHRPGARRHSPHALCPRCRFRHYRQMLRK